VTLVSNPVQSLVELPVAALLRLPNKLTKLAASIPQEIAYRSELAQYASQLPSLSSENLAIVNALETEGVFATSLDALALPSTAGMLRAAEGLIPGLPNVPSARSGFDVHAEQAEILKHPALFQWGLEARLLDIAESYLKLPVAFNDIHLRKDFPNGVKAGSRRWHVDSYDHRILRIIIYLNDVDETGGPFQYISRRATKNIVPVLEQFGTLPDSMVGLMNPANFRSCTGPKGTVLFIATSRIIHRGKPPTASDRTVLVFNYNSKRLKRPQEGKPLTARADRLAIANFLSQRQKQCLLWQ
jgi:hypothetical protein